MKQSWGKIEPVRHRPAKKGPTCTKWQCKSAELVKLKPGKELSTKRGEVTVNHSGLLRMVCPNCGEFYAP